MHWQGVAATDTATSTTDAQDRLVRQGAATYAHTADGERTMRIVGADTTRYAYDALGSLVQVVLPGADTVRYRHDGLGRRAERRQAGMPTQRWLYGDAIPPVAELDETDAVVARYVYGTWGHSPDLMLTPSAGYRVVSDHLGSVRMLVDTLSGTVVRRVQRTAWGVATLDTGSVATSLGYAGGLTDPATGLVRFGARDHDPATGRWTARDPIGLAGGTNVYAYAANRPERLVDPEGMISTDDAEMRMENGFGLPRRPPRVGSTLPLWPPALRARAEKDAELSGVPARYRNAYTHALGGEYARLRYGFACASAMNEFKEFYDDSWGDGHSSREVVRDLHNTGQGIRGRHKTADGRPDTTQLIPDPTDPNARSR